MPNAVVNKSVNFMCPEIVLDQIDYIAQVEGRTRSGLLVEICRKHIDTFKEKESDKIKRQNEQKLAKAEAEAAKAKRAPKLLD